MTKTILITGATDGIGLEAAKILVKDGHHVILSGRNAEKMAGVVTELSDIGSVDSFIADLSDLNAVGLLIEAVTSKYSSIDVLINNAGVAKQNVLINQQGFDVRFVVNAIAPYRLTTGLLPLLSSESRVVNITSAAQSPVDIATLKGEKIEADDFQVYAQSKLAMTMWTVYLANRYRGDGPVFVAVNPGSLLGTKMVKEYFGTEGKDVLIGANILVKAALSDTFFNASGKYFDNDAGYFGRLHQDVDDKKKVEQVMSIIKDMTNTVVI
jgi:NAD(P)-dependent dehydrogenase (short-subunit alcohol dehydrogenase family)